MGKGLVFVEGPDWVRHRRAVSPAFNIDKLKVRYPCSISLLLLIIILIIIFILAAIKAPFERWLWGLFDR